MRDVKIYSQFTPADSTVELGRVGRCELGISVDVEVYKRA